MPPLEATATAPATVANASQPITCGPVKPLSGKFTNVPAGFPMPPIPADNPVTPEKVQLGRNLFYEVKLSTDNTVKAFNVIRVTLREERFGVHRRRTCSYLQGIPMEVQ